MHKIKIKYEYSKTGKINIRTKRLYRIGKPIFLGSVSLGIRINTYTSPNEEQMILRKD